jgi:hypothetical protein
VPTPPVDTLNPPVTPWPDTSRLVPLDIARTHDIARVHGMTTEVPGLVITPALTGIPGRFTGGWSLTHYPTGRTVAVYLCDQPLVYPLEAARFLHRHLPDPDCWTRHPATITTDTAARRTVAGLALQTQHAAAANQPLWWERDSWHATNSRPDRPLWMLQCAAPLCTTGPDDGPNCVWDWDDDDVPFPLTHPDKAMLAADAELQQWRQYDKAHWLCGDCATAHQATHHPH